MTLGGSRVPQRKIEALESNEHGFNFALPPRSFVTLEKLLTFLSLFPHLLVK